MTETLLLLLGWVHWLDDLWLAGALLAGRGVPRLSQREFVLNGTGTLRTGEEIQRFPGKRVLVHGWLNGRRVVAKFYLGRIRQWWEWYRGLRGARAFLAVGVPAPAIRHAGFVAEVPGWLTVLDYVECDRPWPPDGDAIPEDAHFLLLDALADHHARGVEQNDLNSKNFLPRDGKLWSIDGDRVRRGGRPLPTSRARRNLVRFYGGKTAFDETAIREGYRRYCQLRDWAWTAADEERFLADVRLARRVTAERVARRSLQGWKHFRLRRRGDIRLIHDQRALPEPTEPALLAIAERCRRDGNASGSLAEVPVHSVAIPQGHLGDAVIWLWHGSRAARAWSKGVMLRRLRFPAPRVVALLEHRAGGPLTEGCLLFRDDGVTPLTADRLLARPAEAQRILLQHLAALMRAMRDARLIHTRLNLNAFGTDNAGRVQLLDVDHLRRYPGWLPGFRLVWRWGLRRLLAELTATPGMAGSAVTLLTTPD
ncbi:MAG: hypothetical protein JJT90_14125 [Ectothiorhodospiraceae bacterium]|nr:hypothetical protein [Ectothiorhodospiraceae bacterium]